MDLRELDGLAAGIVVRMRHEPLPHAKRLFKQLAATWVVDENADACAVFCGRPECVSGTTRRELAERIDAETRRRNLPLLRERVEREINRGAPILPSKPMSSNHRRFSRPCRTDGCEHEANTRYERGPLSGLCEDACVPRRKDELAEASRARWAERHNAKETTMTVVLDEPKDLDVPKGPNVRNEEVQHEEVAALLYLVEGFTAGTLSIYEDHPDGESRRNDDIRDTVARWAAEALRAYDSSIVGDVVKERLLNAA